MTLPQLVRPFIARNKQIIGLILLLNIITSIASLILPLSIGKFMELMFSSGRVKTVALHVLGIYLPDSFEIFFLFFAALILVKFFSAWWSNTQSGILGVFFVNYLRTDLFNSQLERKIGGEKLNGAELLSYTNEAKTLQTFLIKGIIGFIKDLLFFAMALFILFRIEFRLTLVFCGLLIFFFFLQFSYSKWQKKILHNKRTHLARLINHITRSLIVSNTPKNNTLEKFVLKTENYTQSMRSYHRSNSFQRALTPLMMYLILGVVMLTMYLLNSSSNSSTGDIVSYLLLLMNIIPTLRNIIRNTHIWTEGKLSARKFLSARNKALRSASSAQMDNTSQTKKDLLAETPA